MRRNDVEHRREHILQAALHLLRRDGYKRTTIADIAQEANISVGSVYLEFESKDAIAAELSSRCHSQVLERMECAVRDEEDPRMALHRALQTRVTAQHELSDEAPHSLELFHCGSCSGVARAVAAFARKEHSFVRDLLERGLGVGAFELTDRSDVVAGTLLRLLDRLGPTHERELKGKSLEREVERACDLLVGGLLARPG